MAKKTPEVNVRAYDLGGFGDIAGAMRVASFLQRRGLPTQITYCQDSAQDKLRILNPDTPVRVSSGDDFDSAIQIDIAGHYGDRRVRKNKNVPHAFTEDMDNSQNRKKETPLYLKSGLTPKKSTLLLEIRTAEYVPMFYRPFREWELPKPEERDARTQIREAYRAQQAPIKKLTSKVIRTLEKTDKIGFAHFNPGTTAQDLFSHPYFSIMQRAHQNTKIKLGVGVFFNKQTEKEVAARGIKNNWNVVRSDGTIERYCLTNPTIFCLGPQPQTTTTGLFLSANIPNLVTGDLSLSDAMYGLIAMNGPAFFYETAPWKGPTFNELTVMFNNSSIKEFAAKWLFTVGSNPLKVYKGLNEEDELYMASLDNLLKTFAYNKTNTEYRIAMQKVIRREVRKRFGEVQVQARGISKGFYIQPGAPYLLQDATESVVDSLRANQTFFAKVEKARERISR